MDEHEKIQQLHQLLKKSEAERLDLKLTITCKSKYYNIRDANNPPVNRIVIHNAIQRHHVLV